MVQSKTIETTRKAAWQKKGVASVLSGTKGNTITDNRPQTVSQLRQKDVLQKNRIKNKKALTVNASSDNDPALTGMSDAPVQRYYDLSKGPVWGYGKGTGASNPNFEFQKSSVHEVLDNNNSTRTYNIHVDQVHEDAPKLKVSNNNDMAVPTADKAEAKHFFATPGIIAGSNHQLANLNTPVRLQAGPGRVTLPNGWLPFGGAVLTEVRPNMAGVVMTSSECGTFANEILGVNTGTLNLYPPAGHQQVALGVPNRDAAVNAGIGHHNPETIGASTHADPNVGEAFGIIARRNLPQQNYYQMLVRGMDLLQLKLRRGFPHMQWGEHWAGVVAKSGGDYVTLENYNRIASGSDLILEHLEVTYKDFKKQGLDSVAQYFAATGQFANPGAEGRVARLIRLGRQYFSYAAQFGAFMGHYATLTDQWYFAMYGSGKQSFHEQWRTSAPDAVTGKFTQ